MNGIRHLIVSDLHLAASNSILTTLTPDLKGTLPHEPSEVLRQFVACIHALLAAEPDEPPVSLILNGDFMELALAGLNQAAMCFQGFARLLLTGEGAKRIDKRIICIPGNHDHHVWNTARETHYVEQYLAKVPAGEFLNQESYVTGMVEDDNLRPVPLHMLDTLCGRFDEMKEFKFVAIYPNYALLNKERTRCLAIHHGHYVESIYSAMTRLRDILFPDRGASRTVQELEAENGAWVDFVWSTLGRSGEVGTDVELIHDKMQDPKQFALLLDRLATKLAEPSGRAGFFAHLKKPLIDEALGILFRHILHREVHQTDQPLSPAAQQGLKDYLEVYLKRELENSLGGTIPPEVTFVFGHTHKPFEMTQRYEGFTDELKVYNSGGWVVDTLDADPLHGSAMIVADEALNVASIRMYNEGNSEVLGAVHVIALDGGTNPLAERLKAEIAPQQEPWCSFTKIAARAVHDHRENLRQKVEEAAS